MTEDIFNAAYSIWNSLIEIAMTLFTTSPTAANGDVYSTCKSIFDSISDIAIPIATVFFLIAICKEVISTAPEQQLKKFLNDVLKFCVMIGVLVNLWDVMGYIMQIADGLTDKVASNASATYKMEMSDNLKDIITEVSNLSPTTQIHFTSFGSDLISFAKEFLDIAMTRLLFFIAAIVTLGVIVAACVSIINSAYQRILKPLVILPLGYLIAAIIGYVQDNSIDVLTGAGMVLKKPFVKYFNQYTPITMILGFIAFEVIFFLIVMRSRKLKDNEEETLFDSEVIDLAEVSFEKNNDQNVLNSDDLLEELQERGSGESELNKSLYISPEEDDGIDLREQISVFKEKKGDYSKKDSENPEIVSFSDDVVTDLLNDYDLSQIKAMLPLKEHISSVNVTLLRRMFKPTMSADEIGKYIKIFYE